MSGRVEIVARWARALGLGALLLTGSAVDARGQDLLPVTTLELSQELPSNGRLGGVAVDRSGNLYVSNFGASVWRIDPSGRVTRLATELRGSSGNTVTPDGRLLQASFLENRIVEIGPEGGVRTVVSRGLEGPVGMAGGPDGRIYACNCRGNSVSVTEPHGETRMLARDPRLDCPNGITLGPGGRLYVVSYNNAHVLSIDPSGEIELVATLPQGQNAHIAFAAGALWVTRIAAGELWRVGLDGSAERVLGAEASGLRHPNGVAASPDGRFLYLNDLVGLWKGDVETRIVVRKVGPLNGEGGADPGGLGALERLRIPVGEMVFDARAAGPQDGPLVLLLHGFPQTSFAFRHQLRVLGGLGYRAVAPDQRGYSPGARPPGVEPYAMEHLVRDVVGIADALGAPRFHLAGHDWGGAVAWVTASVHPDRVRSLTVLSTPHYGALGAARGEPGSDQARRSSYFSEFAAPGAEERFLAEDAAYLRELYGGLEPEAVEVYLEALASPQALRAALAWYAAAFGPSGEGGGASADSPPRPPPIRVPTLYVWSTQDPSFGRAPAEATARFVSGPYRFEVLERVGHWLPEETAEEVSRLLVEQILATPRGTASSYRRARGALERAREALGAEAVDGFSGLRASYEGVIHHRGQSPEPGPPFDTVAVVGSFAYEEGGRVLTRMHLRNPGGTDRTYRRMLGLEEGWNLWEARKLLTELSSREVGRLRRTPTSNVALAMPHSLVRAALDEPASLRWSEEAPEVGAALQRVSFRHPDGMTLDLVVDLEGLPRAAEWLTSDPRQGDAVASVRFRDYRAVGGLEVPYELAFRVGRDTTWSWRLLDVTVNPEPDDDRFARPPRPKVTRYPPAFRPRELAPGTWALRLYSGPANSYSSLLVELDSTVVVVEPVLADLFAGPVTRVAGTLAPGKPVGWVVATHHHSDHLGGALGYLGLGARLATTPDGARVVREMASARSTLAPNPATGLDLSEAVVQVPDRLVLGRGPRRVELLRVAPSPHARQMLVAYVPHAKVVYVADLFALPESGVYPPTPLTRHFASALEALGLDVEVIVPAHGVPGTPEDLRNALRPAPDR